MNNIRGHGMMAHACARGVGARQRTFSDGKKKSFFKFGRQIKFEEKDLVTLEEFKKYRSSERSMSKDAFEETIRSCEMGCVCNFRGFSRA